MCSGTAALHVALQLAGVRPEDEVIIPALTFIAPANAVRYCGAWPTFADVDPVYWQLDPDEVERFLTADCVHVSGGVQNRHTGRTVRALLPVDILGHPCDLGRLQDLAERFELALVEDATESLGASYRGKPVGSISRMSCFSFNGNKIITTGGGGMLTTADRSLAERARYLSTQAKDDPSAFVHKEIGYNYRLTALQAAVGLAQLERLPEFLERKRSIAARYAEVCSRIEGLTFLAEASWAEATFWLSTIQVDPEAYGEHASTTASRFAAVGIDTRPLWQPLHRSTAHADSFSRPCPVAEHVVDRSVCLPSSTGISDAEIDRVIAVLDRS